MIAEVILKECPMQTCKDSRKQTVWNRYSPFQWLHYCTRIHVEIDLSISVTVTYSSTHVIAFICAMRLRCKTTKRHRVRDIRSGITFLMIQCMCICMHQHNVCIFHAIIALNIWNIHFNLLLFVGKTNLILRNIYCLELLISNIKIAFK